MKYNENKGIYNLLTKVILHSPELGKLFEAIPDLIEISQQLARLM